MEKYYPLALDYIEGIYSGEIIACKQIKLSVARVTIARQELEGTVCTGGFDGSSDAASTDFLLYFKLENDESAALTWFWCPENFACERAEKDGVQYLNWIADGFVHATPGDAVDIESVTCDILNILKDYKCKAVDFDRWRTGVFVKPIENADGESASSYNNPKHFSQCEVWNNIISSQGITSKESIQVK